VYDIAKRLVGQRDVSALIDEASHALMSTVGAKVVVFGLTCDPENESEQLIVRPEGMQGTEVILSQSVLRRTIDARQAILISDTSSDLDLARAESIVMGGIHSALCVPMMRDADVAGFIYMDNRRGGRPYNEGDLRFVYAVGAIVGTAIENARLHEAELVKQRMQAELDSARSVQQAIMPTEWPNVTSWEICGYHAPCFEVGGDYYDAIVAEDGRIWLIIADVAGKGVPAALLASSVHAAVHAFVDQSSTPADLLQRLNDLLMRRDLGSLFITCLVAVIEPDTGKVLLSTAGHPPPILVQPSAPAEPLKIKPGLVLGIREHEQFVDMEWSFPSHAAALLMYTDGVTEAATAQRELFGEKRLLQTLTDCHAADGEKLITAVRQEIDNFKSDQPAADDVTLLVAGKLTT